MLSGWSWTLRLQALVARLLKPWGGSPGTALPCHMPRAQQHGLGTRMGLCLYSWAGWVSVLSIGSSCAALQMLMDLSE